MAKQVQYEVAYILKGFPRLSETFITNEIYLLEQMGMRLRLYSVKPGETEKVHSVVARIQATLHTLPEVASVSGCSLLRWLYQHSPKFKTAHLRLLKRKPWAYVKTFAQVWLMAWRYRPSGLSLRKSIIKEFLQAGAIAADVVDNDSIRHLHGHFCHGATTITWFVSRLTGLSFSFTAHAKDIYQQKLNPGDLLQRKLHAARFVATCTGANVSHLRQMIAETDKVYQIYHGLDTTAFMPPDRGRDDEQSPLLLAVGRFVEKKGFLYLIEACAQLASAGLRFRCLIIGEVGEQFEAVRQRVEKLNLTDCVVLQNAITQDELKAVYAQATVFALPCQVVADGDRDGIPNVLVEAMAMALSVVSTPISGIPELVENGINGLLVPTRDSQALAQAIEQLLREPALRSRLGANARATVCRDFDSSETTKVLRTLFVEALYGEAASGERAETEQVVA